MAGAAASQAASVVTSELTTLAKGTLWAGFAKVRANDKVDTDDDTISRTSRVFGETEINLHTNVANGKAKANVDVDYEIGHTVLGPGESPHRHSRQVRRLRTEVSQAGV
jgi:hypothetical protein